ncbi:MAG: tyrosine-type recombinase/integrase, partial [Firmicutes bacterium]|nr:tyrosine-type recombinase/integrase [Bacillota bacterium]
MYTEEYLKRWRDNRTAGETALFIAINSGRRLSWDTVTTIVKQAVQRSGIGKKASAHTFRHSMATHLL